MIYNDVIDRPRSDGSLRVIVSIDIKKAFDSVPHESVVSKMEEQGLTGKQLDFVKSFLANRKYRIKAGYGKEAREGPTIENNIGVPQGAVLLPTLFNIVMAPLLWRLYKIEKLKATAYADDVTIWTHEGTPEQQEAALQEGLNTIGDFLKEVGMRPSPEKTKYTVFGAGNVQRNLQLTFAGDPIVREESIKLLGVTFGNSPSITDKWMAEMRKKWKQGLNLVRRISHRLGGAGEATARKLVMATLVSKITYAARFYSLRSCHKNHFRTMLNDARRAILGLPRSTKTERMRQLILLPEIEDLLVQQTVTHTARVHHTEEGRAVASYIGIKLPETLDPLPPSKAPWDVISVTQGAKPLPRNMDPERHKARRKRYAQQHKKEVKELLASQHNTVVYVDGATKGKEYAAGAVFYRGEGATPFEIATSCGLGTEVTSDTVEEAALLFTLGVYGNLPGKTRNLIIYTDSQEAVRNMYKLKATASPTVHAFFDTALSLYREHGTRISVRWVPGHQEISGNDMAHAAAQCGMRRILQLPSQQASNCEESVEQPENTTCYDPVEELRRCRKMRKIQLAEKWQPEDYPLPAKTFKRKETVQLRRIRTEGAVTPRLKYHINLSQLRRTQPYAVPPDPRCQRCKDPEAIPRLDHLLWECQALALCRVEAIETLPEEERPKRLVDWTHPQGEAQRRTRILQSLLDFVAKSDLGDSI
ncbi:uncharacterized protein LOC121835437 [Ixodes scapularis]|uniref:uncharacterized protein LOC121835437 n=1 Tax=Ixodes scapularis TaxID=6945 RepID=UPI001C385102|nr:uncharacterized protein LOC121835437 [Ixodes scapularis]